jgi:hypothetical protein
MPDWNTRLEVKLGDKTISPISTVSPTFTLNHTPVHSIEADNVGVIRQPFTFTFTMTIPAIGTAVADLTELALTSTEFTVAVAEKQGTDWSFRAIKFARCLVTSAAPSNVVIDGAPQATFSCMALSVGIEA